MMSKRNLWLGVLVAYVGLACVSGVVSRKPGKHEWWDALGPVIPHETFPADCQLCHVGDKWQELAEDFTFDHAAETGVELHGAHDKASCLRCHNDRGPVEVFTEQGCAGCHEDIHQGQISPDCTACHNENTWRPTGQILWHNQTRFPLIGAHANTSCRRCHPGAEVGRFTPTDTECLTCHQDDLANALNPNHAGLGFVDRCDRCHIPTVWQQADFP